MQNGAVLTCDPDAIVCWVGADPGFKLDLSWKNLIGQASGESYMFEWQRPVTIVVQPNERTSGLDVSMDGKRTGQQAQRQQNQTLGQATNQVGNTMQTIGGVLSDGGGPGNSGLGGLINNLFN